MNYQNNINTEFIIFFIRKEGVRFIITVNQTMKEIL